MCLSVPQPLAGGAGGLARLHKRNGRFLNQISVPIQIDGPLRAELLSERMKSNPVPGAVATGSRLRTGASDYSGLPGRYRSVLTSPLHVLTSSFVVVMLPALSH